jgi:hypothetical protein
MSASSLKAFIPILAGILGVTPAALYERQRALVSAGLLDAEAGRGPGSGVRTTATAVAVLVIAMLASEGLSQAARNTATVVNAKSASRGGRCPITGKLLFRDALGEIFVRCDLAQQIAAVSVSRTQASARIWRDGILSEFKGSAQGASRATRSSEFTGWPSSVPRVPTPITLEATLEQDAIRAIADEVGSVLGPR